MKLKVILTGATGMVGEGVLHECLQHQRVEQVLVINRKPCGMQNPKLQEILHQDFSDLSPVAHRLVGFNTCFFCLGVSSVGMKEEEYYRLTHTLTISVASLLVKQNSDMVFCYISGAGTNSSENGKLMWARVKGKTENDLVKLPFKKVYCLRPGYMHPTKGLRNTLKYYRYISWLYPVFRFLFPGYVSTLKDLGLAMIHVATDGYSKNILEVKDILLLAKQENQHSRTDSNL